MIEMIVALLVGFVLAVVDSFIPFIPPVTPTMGFYIAANDYGIIRTLMMGVIIGIGTTSALFFYRNFFKKVKNKKLIMWECRVSILIHHMGYYIIIPLQATALGAAVGYTFLFVVDIDWKRYFVFTTIGRTLALILFAQTFNVFNKTGNIIIFIIYFSLAIIVIVNIFLNREMFQEMKNITPENSMEYLERLNDKKSN